MDDKQRWLEGVLSLGATNSTQYLDRSGAIQRKHTLSEIEMDVFLREEGYDGGSWQPCQANYEKISGGVRGGDIYECHLFCITLACGNEHDE